MANWGLRGHSDNRPVDRYFQNKKESERMEKMKKERTHNIKSDYCDGCGRIYYNCVCGHDDIDDE